MEISFADYQNKYINTGSEIMLLNPPVITTDLLQGIKKTKRVYVLENRIYDSFDRKGISAFIDAISSFEFKLFHIFHGVIDIRLSEKTRDIIKMTSTQKAR